MSPKYIIGIDEVGRGPVAGPVSVGIVVVEESFDFSKIGSFTDSKKMTAKAREHIYESALHVRTAELISFGVYSVDAKKIDELGISRAIAHAIASGLTVLAPNPGQVSLFLDGSLWAPPQYAQETIIRGDALVPAISLASVVAKVERDRYMSQVAHTDFPEYGFAAHKGYGTKAHMSAIKKHGLSPLHRASFLQRYVVA